MSRGIRTLLPAVTGLVVLGLTAGPAAADPGFAVPREATVTIRGAGSGHGIGLSQYGAYGAANDGLGAGEILDFYYPGTMTGTATGPVKVWISGDDDRDLVLADRDGLTVAEVGGRTWRPREPRATRWRVAPTGDGDNVVSYRTRTWHRWKVVSGDVELGAGGEPLTLRTPHGQARYRGVLRTTELTTGQRITVNELPLEQYLRGVVPAEMQAGWPQQALRAQAVAARTFAVFERGDGHTYYDLCDTSACQAYGGASVEASATTRAVTATSGEVLTHDGEVANAMYSASNGGHTVAGPHGEPYLPAVPDPHEGTSPDYYDWRRTFSTDRLERVLRMRDVARVQVTARDGNGRRGGRVMTLEARERSGAVKSFRGAKVQGLLGLPSTMFEITRVG